MCRVTITIIITGPSRSRAVANRRQMKKAPMGYSSRSTGGIARLSHCLCESLVPKRMRFGTANAFGRVGVQQTQCVCYRTRGCE